MSRENGQLRTCDRCGAQAFFKCTDEGETDGGWTRWDIIEPAVGWKMVETVGDICPECYKEFKNMLESFSRKPPRAKEDLREH